MDTNLSINISGLWFIAWLFTIGYAKLGFWASLLGIIIWPYFLGAALTGG